MNRPNGAAGKGRAFAAATLWYAEVGHHNHDLRNRDRVRRGRDDEHFGRIWAAAVLSPQDISRSKRTVSGGELML